MKILSPAQRIRQMAVDMTAIADRSHLEPPANLQPSRKRISLKPESVTVQPSRYSQSLLCPDSNVRNWSVGVWDSSIPWVAEMLQAEEQYRLSIGFVPYLPY